MKLKLSVSYVIAFLLLLLVCMEAHELVHITTGRMICGCWGTRDFNVWSLCSSCREVHPLWWIATLSGPLFSFLLMWVGMYLLQVADLRIKKFGFALIFANIPFGRITTVMMGGGDEMVVTRHLLGGAWSRSEVIILCSAVVLLLGVPPVIKAGKALATKGAWMYVLGFLLFPLLFLLTYLLTGLNTLLRHGFLSEEWIMGTPLLITIHTVAALALLIMLRKKLSS